MKPLADFPLDALVADRETDLAREQIPRQLLCQRARARPFAKHHVAKRRHHQAREAQAEVLFERLVFGRDDGLPEVWGDLVVADDRAALGREVRHLFAVHVHEARDGARRVVVECGDGRQIVGRGEEQAAHGPEGEGDDEEQRDRRAPRHP